MSMARKRVKTLILKRHSVQMTPEEKDEVVDAVANLMVEYIKKKSGLQPPKEPTTNTSNSESE